MIAMIDESVNEMMQSGAWRSRSWAAGEKEMETERSRSCRVLSDVTGDALEL
jgi:hypothetical protein